MPIALTHSSMSADDRSTRGVVISGLTGKDIALLDIFEGDVRWPANKLTAGI